MKRILFLTAFLSIFIVSFSFKKENVTFTKLPFKQMLPGSSVRRIFQDHKGFIWLGTESGICRYDGYNLMLIKSNIENPNLLSSGNVWCIAQDKQNRIWFGTERGVNIINDKNQIIPLVTDSIIQNQRINSIVCDSQGEVWIGSENGLFRYKDEKTPIKRYYSGNKINDLPGNNINYIYEDKRGNIWIALWRDGLCLYNKKNDSFVKMPRIGSENNPYTIFQDNEEILWIGTWSDGLVRLENDDISAKPTYKQFIIPGSTFDAGTNNIYSITQDNLSGDLWVLSQSGINVISD